MDQESPKFKFDTDSLSIRNIALLPDKRAAEVFFSEIFPMYCSVFVASADRAYPEDPELNKAVFEKLETDDTANIVVFGFDSLHKVQLASQKMLVLDDIIFGSSDTRGIYSLFVSRTDAFRIVNIIRAFFEQWDKIERLGNFSYYYEHAPNINRPRLGWVRHLFIDHETAKKKSSQ